mmetsp:Transcript_36118/g.80374  ORF Transcript_36118/g.80374 Transcript_36118/m.80374 type:complete len:210 (+) Transcript_36118:165-794(+)|eukprot:CAMPEP_0202912790 /NCGR_PEP_ID=MMETSP1392-20130828/58639_1 /ASSEMBLY_ACC=CAM_ASM_000868 /TAXON_ID=225041 /ORGANISM="Chlamydomonas chlamydogama, Strain SAG 11-48b" /LENGTH=209 /DNA_ID=CAMNT_0049603813 /DNA_START=82 /DNA_END=711 /DNA_ORIENTATION=-
MSPISPELLPEGAQGLVFDCDGTLVDSMAYHFDAWKATCDNFGLHLTPHLMVEQAGKPINELFDIICERSGKTGQVDRDEFFKMKLGFYELHKRPLSLIQPVMQIVEAGRARGLKMAVASGGTRWHVMQSLKETGINHLFDAVVCAEDVSKGKPEPDAFLLAAKKLGVEPSLCVGYEDAKLGMEAIRRAGFMAAVDVTVLEGYPHLVPP